MGISLDKDVLHIMAIRVWKGGTTGIQVYEATKHGT